MLSKWGVTRIMQNYPKGRVKYHYHSEKWHLPGNSHLCSAPMAAPSTIALMVSILQMTNRSKLVAYYFWIPMVEELNNVEAYYQGQRFVIKVILATEDYWECHYETSWSLASLTMESISATPDIVIPKMQAETPY